MSSATSPGSKFDEKLLELSSRVDAFELYDHAHGLRVAEIADGIAVKFGMAEHDRFVLQQAAFLHDLGEMAMNRDYIAAARPLTDAERFDLHRHPVIGEQDAAKRGLAKAVQLIIRWHHEWWNGSGYPDARRGEDIPLAARILRVADTYAAMTADRPHRPAINDTDARKLLIEYTALEFDPAVVKAFLNAEARA